MFAAVEAATFFFFAHRKAGEMIWSSFIGLLPEELVKACPFARGRAGANGTEGKGGRSARW